MEHNKCEFVKSRKKNDLLFLNGFLYMLNKKCDNVFYWSCVRKRSSSCGAAVTTKKNGDDHYVHKLNNVSHLHEPDQNSAEANAVRQSLKRKVLTVLTVLTDLGKLFKKSYRTCLERQLPLCRQKKPCVW